MPRKEQGWITFQSSEEERKILEQFCQQSQRSKTEILRELVRSLQESASAPKPAPALQKASSLIPPASPSLPPLNGIVVSARNLLKGTITQIQVGTVNAEVTLEIAPGVELISIITKTSSERLGLAVGEEVYAMIKSSNVMIARC